MTDPLDIKLKQLQDRLTAVDSAVIALSGGVDSGLLAYAAGKALPGRITAVTVRSILNPPGEMASAEDSARRAGLDLRVVDFDPLTIPALRHNRPDRCYHCKKALLGLLQAEAASLGRTCLMEGSNADDMAEHRPGTRALAESGTLSPLREAGLAKADVRELARGFGLPVHDRPAMACLATRFPYGTLLNEENLRQVFAAESVLAAWGLAGTRARHHGDILRLECPEEAWTRLADRSLRTRIVNELAALGFAFVTVDLAGYRRGVFDRKPLTSK